MTTSDHKLKNLAWLLAALFAVAAAARVGVMLGTGPAAAEGSTDGAGVAGDAALYVVVGSLPLTALVILRRQPRNRIGWLLMGTGWVWGLGLVADNYARYGFVQGSLPRPDIAATLNAVVWAPGLGLLGTFLILLFPDGRLPSPRWRPMAWVSAVTITGLTVSILISPGMLEVGPSPELQNPLAVPAFAPALGLLVPLFLLLLPLCMLGCAAAAVVRFRRSRGIERLQMKWLAAAGTIVAALFLLTMLPSLYRTVTSSHAPASVWSNLLDTLSLLSFALLPAAVAVAVLRHNLYDIDLVINRTLVYGSLSLTLGGLYVGSVLLLQTMLGPLTNSSDLAVAGSTLAVAVVFRRVRERIQWTVDRRFYRSRYDAARTLDAFVSRLRHELDLDALADDLRSTVDQTVQPTHVSIWLRRD